MYLLIIVLLVLIYIYILKIKFKILNIDDQTEVVIEIGVLKIVIDYDEFVKQTSKINKKYFKVNDLRKISSFSDILKLFISVISFRKIIVEKHTNNTSLLNIYFSITFYTTTSVVQNFLLSNSKKLDEYYCNIVPSNRNDFDFEVLLDFKIRNLVSTFIINFHKLFKIRKDLI